MTRFAVVGDIHGNQRALDAALSATDELGFDQRIFIGDLLTYGISVAPIVEKMAKLSQNADTVVLRGNHDFIYDQLLQGSSPYKMGLPNWLQNSIDVTFNQIDPQSWAQVLFQDSYLCEKIYFSHANPFGQFNWRYLNTQSDLAEAAQALRENQACAGVFGHTHRIAAYYRGVPSTPLKKSNAFFVEFDNLRRDPIVLNCGSVGQPRDKINREHVLWIETSAQAYKYWFQPIFYDVDGHLSDLDTSDLIPEAKARIRGFHTPQP